MAPAVDAAGLGVDFVAHARTYLNAKYKKGGKGPSSFDCSGLTWRVVKEVAGRDISRDLKRQSRKSGRKVPLGQKQPGDLIFFRSGGRLVHVGFYVAGGKLLSAMNPKDDVDIVDIGDLVGSPYKARRID